MLVIVSHRYRFIFLKTAKTAGTSIEIALSKFLGPDDIITPVSADDELLRKQSGGVGPQNYRHPPGTSGKSLKAVLNCLRKPAFYHHMPATEVRSLVGEHTWQSYFRFCVERNPFDRVISLYYWCCRKGHRPCISEFLQSARIQLLIQRGRQIYTASNGQLLVNRVLRYESLSEELEAVRLQLGIPEPLQLPLAKSGLRPPGLHYSQLLAEQDRQTIEALFETELQLFQYQWQTVAAADTLQPPPS